MIYKKVSSDEIKLFIKFLEKNYIIDGKYKSWNCYHRVKDDIPLTTNICEGWNRWINNALSSPHPTLTSILSIIREKDMLVERNMVSNFSNFNTFTDDNSINKNYNYK